MRDVTTTNLEDFGYMEREVLIEMLQLWNLEGLPKNFEAQGIQAMFNKHSGNVFLTNDEYQACMIHAGKLEMWYTCFNCGHEGFAEDCQLCDEGCNECQKENTQ